MELTSNITIMIFMVTILLSRYINSEAVKKLSMEKKAELIDTFSGFSVRSMVPLLLIIGGFYFAVNYMENYLLYLTLLLSVAGVYVVGLQVYIYKKLKNMDYPLSYIKQYILSVVVRFIGVFTLAYPMIAIFIEK